MATFTSLHITQKIQSARRAELTGLGLTCLGAVVVAGMPSPALVPGLNSWVGGVVMALGLVGCGWRSWSIRRNFGVLTSKPMKAQLTLARHLNTGVDRELYAIERQGRPVTRIEASMLLAQHYNEF